MCFFLVSVTCLLWSVRFPRSLSLVLLTSSRSIFVFLSTVKAVKYANALNFDSDNHCQNSKHLHT